HIPLHLFCILITQPSRYTLFPYTTLFRSLATSPIHMTYKLKKSPEQVIEMAVDSVAYARQRFPQVQWSAEDASRSDWNFNHLLRSEEHTSELQSRFDLVCRLLLEKKNKRI